MSDKTAHTENLVKGSWPRIRPMALEIKISITDKGEYLSKYWDGNASASVPCSTLVDVLGIVSQFVSEWRADLPEHWTKAEPIASDTESDATSVRLHFENGKTVTMKLQGRAPIEIPLGVIGMEAIVDGKSAGKFTVPAGKSIVELNTGAEQ